MSMSGGLNLNIHLHGWCHGWEAVAPRLTSSYDCQEFEGPFFPPSSVQLWLIRGHCKTFISPKPQKMSQLSPLYQH